MLIFVPAPRAAVGFLSHPGPQGDVLCFVAGQGLSLRRLRFHAEPHPVPKAMDLPEPAIALGAVIDADFGGGGLIPAIRPRSYPAKVRAGVELCFHYRLFGNSGLGHVNP